MLTRNTPLSSSSGGLKSQADLQASKAVALSLCSFSLSRACAEARRCDHKRQAAKHLLSMMRALRSISLRAAVLLAALLRSAMNEVVMRSLAMRARAASPFTDARRARE